MAFALAKDKDEKEDELPEQPDHAAPLRADILGSIAGSDPSGPGYLGKIDNLITGHGALETYSPGSRAYNMSVGATSQPKIPSPRMTPAEAPDIGATAMPTGPEMPIRMGQPTKPQQSILGRIGRVASRMGNIAGDIFAPGEMMLIPGTDLNKKFEANIADKKAGRQRQLDIEQEKADTGKSEAATREKGLTTKDEDALAKLGMKRDDKGEIVPDEGNPQYKALQAKIKDAEGLESLRSAQVALTNAKTEYEKAKNDPNSPAFKIAQEKLNMAAQAHAVAARNLGLHEEQFANKLQEQELLKPSGQAESRGSAAKAVLDLIPDLEKNVRANAKEMGPLMGRINRGEVAIGDVSPPVANLYSAMKSFYALQPAVHGFKNAEFVKDFETALGTLERDPEAFIAGMQGLKPTLESVYREGRTSHKRIVEGRDDTSGFKAPEGAPEAPKQDGHKLKQNGKVVAVSKGGKWVAP